MGVLGEDMKKRFHGRNLTRSTTEQYFSSFVKASLRLCEHITCITLDIFTAKKFR